MSADSSTGRARRHVGSMLGLWSWVAVLGFVVFLVGGISLWRASAPVDGDPEVLRAGVPAGEETLLASGVREFAVYVAPAEAAPSARCTDGVGGFGLREGLDPGPAPETRTVDGTRYGLVVSPAPVGGGGDVVCSGEGGVELVMITRLGGVQPYRVETVVLLVLAPLVLVLSSGARSLGRHLRHDR